MLEHTQSHCTTCQRQRLFVRSTYDTPHTAHLIFVCALALAALMPGTRPLSPLLLIAAGYWLLSFGRLTLSAISFRPVSRFAA